MVKSRAATKGLQGFCLIWQGSDQIFHTATLGHDAVSLYLSYSPLTSPKPARAESPRPICQNNKFNWNACIHLIWCHVWIACASGDVWITHHSGVCRPPLPPPTPLVLLLFPFICCVRKAITESEWWNVISGELTERTTVATACLRPPIQSPVLPPGYWLVLRYGIWRASCVCTHIIWPHRHGQCRDSLYPSA